MGGGHMLLKEKMNIMVVRLWTAGGISFIRQFLSLFKNIYWLHFLLTTIVKEAISPSFIIGL